MRLLSRLVLSLMSFALAAPGTALAQVARLEVIPFQTTTLTDQQFLTGQREGKPTIIAGELRIPKPGKERLPAVVLIHGSGGIGGNVDEWAQFINGMGVATFVIDSFTGRGLVSTVSDQSQLGRLVGVVDAYRALELLARHSRIDPGRIAVMGFSRGGQAALYASVKRFQRMHAPPEVAYALYIPVYPDCITTYIDDADVSDKPIRIFHGSADDWDPVAFCRNYVGRLRKAGKDVVLTEYPETHHAFDISSLKGLVKIPDGQTTRHCQLREAADGVIMNGQTGQRFSYADACVELGPTIAYNPQAVAEAQKAVRGLITALAAPK